MPPEKVVDVQALAGDSTDNVPGARGIGIKTAAQLIGDYGDLDTLFASAAEIKQPKRRETLTDPESVKLIRISKELVKLVDDVAASKCRSTISACISPTRKTLVAFFKAMEFTTITKRAAETYGIDAGAIEPDPAFVGPAGWRGRNGDVLPKSPATKWSRRSRPTQSGRKCWCRVRMRAMASSCKAPPRRGPARSPPQAPPKQQDAESTARPIRRSRGSKSLLSIAAAYEAGQLAVDTETTSLDPMQAELVGISLALGAGPRLLYPARAIASEGKGDLFGGGDLLPGQLPLATVLARLKPLLEADGVLKIAHNMKFDWLVFRQHGIEVTPIDDTMLSPMCSMPA